jgi:hypothetical protein
MNSIVALPIVAAMPVAAPAMTPSGRPGTTGKTADPVFEAITKHRKAVRAVKAAGAKQDRFTALSTAAVGPRSIEVVNKLEPGNSIVTVETWIDIEKYISPETDAELYAQYRSKLEKQSKVHDQYLEELVGGDIDELMNEPAEAEWEAADELAEVVPTSLPGLLTMLTYVNGAMTAEDGIATFDENNMTTLFGSLGKAAKALARPPVAKPATAKPSSDPMFGLIDAHRKADEAYGSSLRELERLEKIHDHVDDTFTDGPGRAAHSAFLAVAGGAAITLPGLRAKIAYLQEIAGGREAWMLEQYDYVATRMVEGFAASIENVLATT